MEFTNKSVINMNDEFVLKIAQLTQDVSDIKIMFQELIQISKNNSRSNDCSACHCGNTDTKDNKQIKTKVSRQNNSANILEGSKKINDADFLIKSSTDVSITFTDYLKNMDINQSDLLHIFNIDSYEEGFIQILQMYITPENIYYCPLRSFEDKRGKLFYTYDKDPDDNEKLVWTTISSAELASKLRIIQQKIMSQFGVWQNDNIKLLKSHNFQENYRNQICKLTCGVIDKVIQSNSTFRNKLFELVKL